ncbi:hypothetical protein IAU60_005724 [Kwoniella sp. DSM 27419]
MPPSITTVPVPPSGPILLVPTAAPAPGPVLAERQTYVTISVLKNGNSSTADDGSSTTNKSNKFPVAIAIPALVGGMALALAGFGLWWWWTRKQKREKRAAWEARQRRKRKRAEQSARPSVSSARSGSHGGHGGQKSPINEKTFVPPVPALPKHAAQQDAYKETGYGYNPQPSQQRDQRQLAPAIPPGAFGYSTQPPLESGVTYGYDQYGQPIPQYGGGAQHRRSMSNDSANPANPFGSNAYAATDRQAQRRPQPEPEPEPQHQTQSQPQVKADDQPARGEKSSRRAAARMAAAESAAASASVDPAYRHQPKKPSPLALAAAERKAAEEAAAAAAAAGGGYGQMETLGVPGQASSAGDPARQVSGEWGVALGSAVHDGSYDDNRRVSNGATQRGYAADPYLQQQHPRGKSGQYGDDPYSAYHGDAGEEDGDAYHRAAEGMGLGGQTGTAKKGFSRWV